MSKLNHCQNGIPVTKQVLMYQKSKNILDYIPIQEYYNNYKEQWYNQLEDYLDRETFNSEFDFKLSRAVDKFSDTQSKELADRNGWTDLGRFNRWFFKILSNWKSNVKTSAFRLKKRPPVQCPICGRFVGRIDAFHLEHYRSISDLPKYFIYEGQIFETSAVPRVNAVTWGIKTIAKWKSLQKAETKPYAMDKKRVPWPWYLADNSKGVMCPYTYKILPRITEEYIKTLPDKYSRYAEPISWEYFIETYPTCLIQSETYSLDHTVFDSRDERVFLRDHVDCDQRNLLNRIDYDYKDICSGKIPSEFEFTFHTIEKSVTNDIDQIILKLLAIGYSVEDISDTLEMDRKDIRKRMRGIRDNSRDLEKLLIE